MSNFLIVGASSGIGKQLAEQLADAGHQVFATYHSKEMTGDHPNISYHHCNVLDDELNFDYLPEQLHGLVYCPGSINLKPFRRFKPEDYLDDFHLQVVGAIKVIQTVFKNLKSSDQASIVMFSTVAVQTGFNFHAQVAASKGAIEGLTRSLAAELAPKIRVNCIAPSLTDTPMAESLLNNDTKRQANAERHPLKRVGRVHDIANMAEFLLSEKSSWISGQVMPVDGGISRIKA